MSLPHFLIEGPIDGGVGQSVCLALGSEDAQHMHTLRLRAGERIVVGDGPGHGWELELAAAPTRHPPTLEGILVCSHTSERLAELTLVQGISAAERMDQTVRQVTELGVARIIPLESERSTVRLKGPARTTKQQRWQRIAKSACEQSGQLLLPAIEEPVGLDAALALVEGCDVLLFFWEEPGGRSIAAALDGCAARRTPAACGDAKPRAALFIGPEGGFSTEEARRLEGAGAQVVTLGETVLRTETAAVVASALVLYHLGGLGAR
jgi:16S rRNA (uracil1498-N3)-methyltransferase